GAGRGPVVGRAALPRRAAAERGGPRLALAGAPARRRRGRGPGRLGRRRRRRRAGRRPGRDPGLFTQPFFDLRLLSVWQELTAGAQVFWGVTSVTSPRSQRYWLRRNRAVFPAGFEPTLAWHRDLAARVLDHVAASGGNLYFMPIKVGI